MAHPIQIAEGAGSDADQASMADPVASARSLRGELFQRAEQCEQERRVPEASIAAMRELGLFKVGVPRRAGGPGHRLETLFRVTAESQQMIMIVF